MFEMPLVQVAGELHRHRVLNIDIDGAACAYDLHVVLGDWQFQFVCLRENRGEDLVVGEQAGCLGGIFLFGT